MTASSSSPTTPSRDLSLDFLKGLAIVMVVFFHNIQLNPESIADNLFMLACNAAVPCFFLVSGSLFFSRPFSLAKHIRRMIRFYLVMVIWRGIYLALYHTWGAPVSGSLRTLFSYLFLFQSMNGIETSHFWFMDAMLTVMLIAPLLRICLESNRNIIWYILATLILFNQLLADGNLLLSLLAHTLGKPTPEISSFAEINPFSFRHSNYMTYYLLGFFLHEQKNRITKKASGLMMTAGLTGLAVVKYIQSGTIQWQNLHIASGYYWFSTMLLACGMFFFTARISFHQYAPLRFFARTAGTATMGIFYLHIPLIFLLRPVFTTYLADYNGWLLNLAESLLITAIACMITWAGKKIPVIKHLFQG